MTNGWKPGRSLLGPLKPLLGARRAEAGMPGHTVVCTRTFEPFGKGWVRLEAVRHTGERGDYRETALFGAGDDGVLGFFSFTNDGKRSVGRLADGSASLRGPSPSRRRCRPDWRAWSTGPPRKGPVSASPWKAATRPAGTDF